MGAKAPDTIGLIQQHLIGRDARGLADEYLDTVGWPMSGNRAVSLRHGRTAIPLRAVLPRQRGLMDPARN